jgi:hypothetical protein
VPRLRRALAAALLLLPVGAAQPQPAHGERVDVAQATFPAALVADRLFYVDVTVTNHGSDEADALLFATLYNMTGGSGAPCEGARAQQSLSAFRKHVSLAPLETLTVVGRDAHWTQKVNGSLLDAPGEHEACVWAQLASCPAGTYLACLLDYDPVRVPVRLTNAPPRAAPSVEPARGGTGTLFTFDSGASDADGDPLNLTWELGDGKRAEGARVVHRYAAGATYRAHLTASDGWDIVERDLTVEVARGGGGGSPVPGPALPLGLMALGLAALAARRRR